jgi:hypothetical protein
MAIVRSSLPFTNWVFASVIDGPSSDSGPSVRVFEAAPAVCSDAEIVKTSSVRTPATALAPAPALQLPATNWTFTSPATNMSFGSTPALWSAGSGRCCPTR